MRALTIMAILCSFAYYYSKAQLVVDGKNVNEQKEIEYIQLSFYFETKEFSPIYNIDYGSIVGENVELAQQKITIDGDDVSSRMTLIYVLNKLNKAGWEYLGDSMFVPSPMMENTQLYILRRKAVSKR
jgi:hypothetical protein